MSAALVKCIALTPEWEVVAIVLNDSDNFVEAKTAWSNKEFVTFTNEVTLKRVTNT